MGFYITTYLITCVVMVLAADVRFLDQRKDLSMYYVTIRPSEAYGRSCGEVLLGDDQISTSSQCIDIGLQRDYYKVIAVSQVFQ